jgi:two-component system response regulator AtoC
VRRITSDASAIPRQQIRTVWCALFDFYGNSSARKRFQTRPQAADKKSMFNCILIIDDDEALRESLELVLSSEGYHVITADCGENALSRIEEATVDVVLCDLRMPGIDGFDLLPQITRLMPRIPIIIMSAHGTDDLAVEAIQRGAYDYLAKPFQPSELRLTLLKAHEREELRRQNDVLQREMSRSVGERAIVAASDSMIQLLELLERTAGYKSTVLVTGESGTGKEVIARAIHSQSPRREAPFVAVNCGAIPENLLESELFGHAKGAFTGASRSHAGLFAVADSGTLFLDEIAELPTALQVKLLRAIQEEEIRPVGQTKSQQINVRVIAATARDLTQEMAEGRFREDLFYRLNVVRLEVPPLRDRREDIPLLVDHFLARFREQLGKPVRSVSDGALSLLVGYGWPGNVRELENVIERAVILTDHDVIEATALPQALTTPTEKDLSRPDGSREIGPLKPARQEFEAQFIRKALDQTGGNRTHAAKLLQISHRALLYKLKDYGIRD